MAGDTLSAFAPGFLSFCKINVSNITIDFDCLNVKKSAVMGDNIVCTGDSDAVAISP
jgi:hypothetical protein